MQFGYAGPEVISYPLDHFSIAKHAFAAPISCKKCINLEHFDIVLDDEFVQGSMVLDIVYVPIHSFVQDKFIT